jgi:hypothetical protein
MPPHNTIRQPLTSVDGTVAFQRLKQVLSTIEGVKVLQERSTPDELTVKIAATGNTWSRAARRQKFKPSLGETSEGIMVLNPLPLVCQMTLSCTQLEFNWVQGEDRTLFDSFCSHISRKIASNPNS